MQTLVRSMERTESACGVPRRQRTRLTVLLRAVRLDPARTAGVHAGSAVRARWPAAATEATAPVDGLHRLPTDAACQRPRKGVPAPWCRGQRGGRRPMGFETRLVKRAREVTDGSVQVPLARRLQIAAVFCKHAAAVHATEPLEACLQKNQWGLVHAVCSLHQPAEAEPRWQYAGLQQVHCRVGRSDRN